MKKKIGKKLFCNGCFSLNKVFISTGIYLAVILSAILSHGSVLAASQTYYVTFNGKGSQNGLNYPNSWSWNDFLSFNNWSGSENTSKIDPGDTVYLSGTFNVGKGDHKIPGSGIPGNFIVIDGDDGKNPAATIDANGASTVFYSINKNYLEFRDILFTGKMEATIKTYGGDYIKIHDCEFSVDASTAVRIWASSHHIDIYNNGITQTNPAYRHGGNGIDIEPGHDINIYNNRFIDWGHNGIQILNDKNNANNDSYNVNVYNNYFNLQNRGYGRAFGVSSWYKPGNTYDIFIHHNFISGMRAPSGNSSTTRVYIYDNIFYGTNNCCEKATDPGCTYSYPGCSQPSNSACVGVDDPHDCCTGIGKGNCKDKLYYKTGWHLNTTSNYGDTTFTYIYNNLFYDSAETAFMLLSNSGDIDHLYIKNNIFYNGANAATPSDKPPGSTCSQSDRTIYARAFPRFGYTNVEFENNLIYSPERSKDIHWDGADYTVLAFEKAFSWASKNLAKDPLLNAPENYDFSLRSDSPAIDAGTRLDDKYAFSWSPKTLLPPNPVETLNQNEFGKGWDVGAYIFNSLSKPKAQLDPPANFGLKKKEG